MAAAKKRATLASDLLGADDAAEIDAAAARPKRRGERRRPALLEAPASPGAEHRDPAAEAAIRQAMLAKVGTVFAKKGAASAAPFRPWYWTYEEGKGAAPKPPSAAPSEAATAPIAEPAVTPAELESWVFPFEVPPLPPEPVAEAAPMPPPALSRPEAEDEDEDEHVVAARRIRDAFAERLAAIIEGILATRNFAALATPLPDHARATAGPGELASEPAIEITPDSLMAELDQARPEPPPPPPKRISVDRFLMAGSAVMILAAGYFAFSI